MPPASHDTTDSPVFVNWNSSPLTKAAWVFAFERRTQSNPQYQQYVLFGVDYIKTTMIVRSEEHYVIVNLNLLGKSYTVKDPFPLNATEAYLSLTADAGERAARVIALLSEPRWRSPLLCGQHAPRHRLRGGHAVSLYVMSLERTSRGGKAGTLLS